MGLILKVSILILIASGIQAADEDDFKDNEYSLGYEDNYLDQYYVDFINSNANEPSYTVTFHILYLSFIERCAVSFQLHNTVAHK